MALQDSQSRARRIAERQWGVIAFAQLLDAGFTRDDIRGMVDRGYLLRLYRGVYALGHRRLTMRGQLHAALLASGAEAFLSHRSAAAHRSLCRHPGRIEVTAPTGRTYASPPGLHLHRTTIPTDRTQARPLDGLLVATVPRIVIDVARNERPGEVQRLIRESIRTGQFDVAQLHAAVEGHPHRPGTALTRAALDRYLPGSEDRRSWLETRFQRHQRNDPRLPVPVYNQHLHGYEIDVLWPVQRVALELDGRPYHAAIEDFDRDRGRDRTLTRHGWRPVRVSDFEWEHDRALVLDDLYALLGA